MKKYLFLLALLISASCVAQPIISSFSPSSGPVGTIVTITGSGFTSSTTATIGGSGAIVVSFTATQIVAMVMPGASTGIITVAVAGNNVSSSNKFTVLPSTYPGKQQGNKLVGTGVVNATNQGFSLSISADGNTAMVGGNADNGNQGAVWFYGRTGTSWTQQGQSLLGSGLSMQVADPGVATTLSADGNIAMAGLAYDNNNQGAVVVFTRNSGVWTQAVSKLTGTGVSGPVSWFGSSVALSADGATAAIGGMFDAGGIGAMWIFTRSGSVWTQQGSKLVGTGYSNSIAQIGKSIAISADGNTIMAGSTDNAVWAYARNGNTWTQTGPKLTGSGATGISSFGASLALSADGKTAVIGGIADNSGKGAAWVFVNAGGSWIQQGGKLVGSGADGTAKQGQGVAINADGNTIIVGGPQYSGGQGAAWIFSRTGTIWKQVSEKWLPSDIAGNDNFGKSISLTADGTRALISGPTDNGTLGAVWTYVSEPFGIKSFSPSSSSAGKTVTIKGNHLSATTGVTFGDVSAASFSILSDTLITAVIGDGAGASGYVKLISAAVNDSLPGFVLLPPVPMITSFSPAMGPVGTTVVISGTNFGTVAADNIVYFGAVKATVKSASATSLSVIVPTGGNYQPISVTVRNLTAYSQLPFNVTFSANNLPFYAAAFDTSLKVKTGVGPGYMSVADLDGDGKADIIVPNQNDNTISLLRNLGQRGKPAFSSVKIIEAGVQPYYVLSEDLNGDGKKDIIVSNENWQNVGATISVYKNTGQDSTISFAAKKDYSTGLIGGYTIAIADFDADGKPDIVTASGSGVISVFRNTSTSDSISFAEKITFNAPLFNESATTGFLKAVDMDGDGYPDLVQLVSGGSVYIIKNTCNGNGISFGSRTLITSISDINQLTIADFDNDGKPDIAKANFVNQTVSILRNISSPGTIILANRQDINLGITLSMLEALDIDGDGKIDLVVTEFSDKKLTLLKNKSVSGSIIFDNGINISTAYSPLIISAGDIDNDGKPDFFTTTPELNQLNFYRNRINEPSIFSFLPSAVKTGDTVVITGRNFTSTLTVSFGGVAAKSFTVINDSTLQVVTGTGKAGMVVVTNANGSDSSNVFSFISSPQITSFTPRSAGSGVKITILGKHFTGVSTISFGGTAPLTFTMQNDSVITAVTGNGATGIVRVSNIAGIDSAAGFVFSPIPKIISFLPASGAIGTDIVIKGINFSPVPASNIVYFGAVKATVKAASDSALTVTVPPGASYQLLSVTVNRFTGYSTTPFMVTFKGGGQAFIKKSFSNSLDLQTNFGPNQFKAVDFDMDGKVDLVVGNNRNTLSIFRNAGSNGKDSFAARTDIPITTYINTINFMTPDLNGDGKPDLVVTVPTNTNAGFSGTVIFFRNTSTAGAISFVAQDSIINANAYSINYADLDNDGKPDMIISRNEYNKPIAVYKNTSTGDSISFGPKIELPAFGSAGPLITVDIDGDGKTDIVSGNLFATDNSISVYKNTSTNGEISFGSRSDFQAGLTPAVIAAGDIDGDGIVDIVILNTPIGTTGGVSILRNLSTKDNIAFADKLQVFTNKSFGSLSVGDLDGDGKPDICTTVVPDSSTQNYTIILNRNTSTPGKFSFEPNVTYKSDQLPVTVQSADVNGDGRPDILLTGNFSSLLHVFINRIGDPSLTSFSPLAGVAGDSITLKGSGFSNVSSISFGATPAASFVIKSDSAIVAVLGTGNSGTVKVSSGFSADSLAGFSFGLPEVSLVVPTKNNMVFGALTDAYSTVQDFSVSGLRLTSDLIITTSSFSSTGSSHFSLYSEKDTAYSNKSIVTPKNGVADTQKFFLRFRSATAGVFTDTLLVSSTRAVTKRIVITGSTCDSSIFSTPLITGISKDSVICMKDSVTLSSASVYAGYWWSTGDSTKSISVKSSDSLTLRVASTKGCFSYPSIPVKVIKNINQTPLLALTGSNTLQSSSAPNYRWFYNNNPVAGNSSDRLLADKVGFYAVETSLDKICWDHSNDYLIVTISTPLVNDSVAARAYPNPSSTGSFNIVATLQRPTNVVAKVTVTDVNGIVLLQTNKFIFFGKEIKIPIALSNKGTVFAKLDINGDVKTVTVILQ